MAILEKTVVVNLSSQNIKYYESLNYTIPRRIDKYNKLRVPEGSTLEVKIEDLRENSHVEVTKICDFCEKKKKQTYRNIIRSRKVTGGKDCCSDCHSIKTWIKRGVPNRNSLAEMYPEVAKEFHPTLNDIKPWEVMYASNKEYWWICPVNSNHIYDMPMANRTVGNMGCPYCRGLRVDDTNCLATTHPELLEEWYFEKNDEIGLTPQNVTHGSDKVAWWKCSRKRCGHIWSVPISSRATGTKSGCPKCNSSKAEKLIFDYFSRNMVKFKTQYSFSDLIGVGGGRLRFDFAVLDKGKNPLCLIEYDGEFHFEKQYKDDHFETLQIHDQLKNKYCSTHNIPLLRIPYWDYDNIERILTDYLYKLNITNSNGTIQTVSSF